MNAYLPILMMICLVVVFIAASFLVSQLLGPRRPNPAKQAPYESGIVPEQEPSERFPVKFYLVAMTFIVLDVEIIFLYPFTTIFRNFEPAAYGLVIMGVFLLTLLVPFGRQDGLSLGLESRGTKTEETYDAAGHLRSRISSPFATTFVVRRATGARWLNVAQLPSGTDG